jgi:hypothetical protein
VHINECAWLDLYKVFAMPAVLGSLQGYSKGDPQKRVNYVTALGYVGIFGLVGTTIKFAADMFSK